MKLLFLAIVMFVILPYGSFKVLDRVTDSLIAPHQAMAETAQAISAASASSDPLAALECQKTLMGAATRSAEQCAAMSVAAR